MSNNIGSAIVLVGVLFTHLLSLEYEVSFPSVILWIVGLMAGAIFLIGSLASIGQVATQIPKKRRSRK